uniref:Myocilin n=1 Tax=Ciona savignyi TaxID=51511 RepID=H2Z0I5_CIOSA
GKLVSISEPITFRESASYLGEIGAWMQDPVVGGEQIYVIKIIGENQVRKLFEYANMADFRNHRNEVVRIVPDAMESNGAVVYNGSLYYQRRNSRKIVRYHISTQQVLRQRPIKQAAFHGAQAYQWGGYSDIDLTVDETGLWVIYRKTRNESEIKSSTRLPKNCSVQKRGVANAFIICQVLYTVNSFSDANAINFSYNLNTRTRQKLKIPFINLYRQNVMIDYNPLNRHIYSWDNGYQVAYKSKVDDS